MSNENEAPAETPVITESAPEENVNKIPEKETIRRDFINSVFGLLKGLAIHNIKNEALMRPLQNFQRSSQLLLSLTPGMEEIELKYQDSLLTLMGTKVLSHFSIAEAQKELMESMEVACIESVIFRPNMTPEGLAEFFSKWAFHLSMQHGKPKPFEFKIDGIETVQSDPEKTNSRIKSRELLLSPRFALERYYFLRVHTEEFFAGIAQNKLISQNKIRRDLIEIAEIGRIAPYQLVAMSLIREQAASSPQLAAAISQATATALLAMVMAKELNFSIREQVNLGLVGLMYNIGLLGERAAPIRKPERLSPEELKQVLEAQASGVYHLLRLQGASRPVLVRLLSIFENVRGSETKSISLTLESRLLRLVSQYVALTSDRPYRPAYSPSEAMKILGSKALPQNREKGSTELDPLLYFVFVRFMGVHPVGSLCLMSNEKKAIIFRPSGEKAGIPLVKFVTQSKKEHSVLVDLVHEPGVQIVKPLNPRVEGVQVSGYFFA